MHRLAILATAGLVLSLTTSAACGQPRAAQPKPAAKASAPRIQAHPAEQASQAPARSAEPTRPEADPTATVSAYLDFLAAGDPFRAIDECFEPALYAGRIFGKDMESLSESERTYMIQMAAVGLKAAVSTLPSEDILRHAERTPYEVTTKGNEARITFTISAPAHGITHKNSLILRQTDAGWKIIDMEPVAATIRKSYASVRTGEPAGTIEFMESLTSGMFESKHQRRSSAASSARLDAQKGIIQTQLETIANQIELFKAREQRYPDFARGWSDLLAGGYIKVPPVNPINDRSEIITSATGKTDAGWHWDETTATLGASFFDERTDLLTLDRP